MSLVYVGKLSLAALVPSVYLSMGSIGVSLNASLQGNLALNASLSASPPTLASVLSASADFSAALLDAELSVPPVPNVSFSVSDCVTLTASLNASFSLLSVLEGLLSAAVGIYAFAYAGTGSALGAAVTSELATSWPDGAPSSGAANALVFGAASSIAQTQLAALLNGLPSGAGLVYGGKLGLSAISPVTNAAVSQATPAINVQLAATAALKASLSVTPPSFPSMISAQAKFAANLSAIPNVKFALAATAKAAASLSAKFGNLCALGATLERFDATLFVYTYAGAANALGAALTAALSTTWGDGTTPTSSACTAALLATTDSLAVAAMSGFFNGA